MQKTIFLIGILIALTGCKNESKASISGEDGHDQIDVRELTGNFIYFEDAGVLQTKSELFGVIANEKAQELIKRAEPLKDQPTDEVNVTLKVKVTKKPKYEEGWDQRVDIIDIITVSKVAKKNSNVIKLKAQE